VLLLAACDSRQEYHPGIYSDTGEYTLAEENADPEPEDETYHDNQPHEDDTEEAVPATYQQLPDFLMPVAVTLGPGRILDYYPELPGKIAILTDTWRTNSNPYQVSPWVTELVERHGPDNVIVYAWSRLDFRSDEVIVLIEAIANNPEIKMLIISPAWYRTDHIVSILRETRDDIFVIYLEYRTTNEEQWHDDLPFRDNNLAWAATNANLILNIDTMNRTFPAQAMELGARTLVYFYDTSIVWAWGEEDYDRSDEYEESDLHRFMRDKSAEIGLQFVEVDIRGAIQCGSSFHMFMEETIPHLIEELGTDIVLFGLDNERVFWSWSMHGFIYLPMSGGWFEPDIVNLAVNLQISDMTADSTGEIPDMHQLISEIRQELNERGLQGRIAALPMSTYLLLPLAAAEYGVSWMRGEMQNEGIDINSLEQIMVDIIAERTGLHNHGVTLTTLVDHGVTYYNYILAALDHFPIN